MVRAIIGELLRAEVTLEMFVPYFLVAVLSRGSLVCLHPGQEFIFDEGTGQSGAVLCQARASDVFYAAMSCFKDLR